MKKIFLIVFITLFTTLNVNAATYDPASNVTTVGNTIISKNALPKVTFNIVDAETTNLDVLTTKKVNITKNQLSYTGNNNEVAAIVAYELGNIVNNAASKKDFMTSATNSILANVSNENLLNAATMTQQLMLNNMSEKDQMNADITGADLMINAGYNPLAIIVVLGKMPGSVTDTLKGQPNNFKRSMNVYDYLAYNYPDKIKAGYACNEYRLFLEHIQPTLDKRINDKKVYAKYEKEQVKAKKERAKQLTKYKTTGGANAWNIAKTLLEEKTANTK